MEYPVFTKHEVNILRKNKDLIMKVVNAYGLFGTQIDEILNPDLFKSSYTQDAIEILVFLNQKLGKKPSKGYRPVPSTLNPIINRLKEGYTPLDLRRVIIVKVNEWKNNRSPNFNGLQYARPSTLFRASNFQSYYVQMKEVFHDEDTD